MYRLIIRPLLFKLSPETIHHILIAMLRVANIVPGCKQLISMLFTIKHPSLEREVFGIKFANPIGMAAGFDKDAEVYKSVSAFGFGFVEIGTVTPKPQPGNPRPRIFRLVQDGAIVNRMGFNNRGIECAVCNLRDKGNKIIVGGNIGKNTLTPNDIAASDYLKVFRNLYQYVDYFVVNVSCPNVAAMTSLQNTQSLMEILEGLFAFRRGQNQFRPILLKISPDLTTEQLDDIIELLLHTPLDGIVATNTTTSRENLKTDAKIVNSIGNGGLSGAPLTERSIEMVRYIHTKTDGSYPIIGVGGMMTTDDVVRMLEAGASLVQLYTGFIYNGPGFVKKICKRLINNSLK